MVSKRQGAPRAKSIGTQIDAIFKLRGKLAEQQKKVDEGKKKLEQMKFDLIEHLHKQGIEGSKGKLASVSITTAVHAQPVDWDAFHEFVYENKAAHMFYRRISDTTFREMLEMRGGEAIPGVDAYEKESLSIRRRTT